MLKLLALILVTNNLFGAVFAYRMVCVYTNWSQYRPDKGKFLPENVKPHMCTHLIYVYAKLKGAQLEPSEWNDDSTAWNTGMYSRVNSLKQNNTDLKVLLGVGGWEMGSKGFSLMAARKSSRERFASSAIDFLRERDFDGLAIDWQYPTQRGGRKLDKKNYSLLLKELRRAFDAESVETGFPKLLLVAGVAANKQIIDNAYEVEQVSNLTDFLNVMAYDLHGSWDNFTGHPSPLYPRKDETGPQAENNVDTLLKYWVSKGADPGKLVLGVSTYGRTFTLRTKKHNGYGVPAKGPGDAGDYTRQAGMLAFYERCSLYFDATRVWDNYSKVPYWYSGRQWIGGEDTDSVRDKVNWIRSNKFGGMMFWSLDTDDFDGEFCGNGVFPLVSAAVEQFAAPLPIAVKPDAKNETRLVASDTKEIKEASTNSKVATNLKDQNDIRPLKKVSNNPTLSQKLKNARILDVTNQIKGEKNEANVKIGGPDKVGLDIVKTENENLASKKEIDTMKLIKPTEIKSNTRGLEVTDKSSIEPKDSIPKMNEKKPSVVPKVKAKSNKQLQGKPQVKAENKNNKINVVKNKKPVSQNRKRKRPQRGRKRKQWRRRRPPPKGRRRQRKRNLNKMGKRKKIVQKKAKPKVQKENKVNSSSSMKTDPTTTSKPEKKTSSMHRKNR